jgi:hypothetical protein
VSLPACRLSCHPPFVCVPPDDFPSGDVVPRPAITSCPPVIDRPSNDGLRRGFARVVRQLPVGARGASRRMWAGRGRYSGLLPADAGPPPTPSGMRRRQRDGSTQSAEAAADDLGARRYTGRALATPAPGHRDPRAVPSSSDPRRRMCCGGRRPRRLTPTTLAAKPPATAPDTRGRTSSRSTELKVQWPGRPAREGPPPSYERPAQDTPVGERAARGPGGHQTTPRLNVSVAAEDLRADGANEDGLYFTCREGAAIERGPAIRAACRWPEDLGAPLCRPHHQQAVARRPRRCSGHRTGGTRADALCTSAATASRQRRVPRAWFPSFP